MIYDGTDRVRDILASHFRHLAGLRDRTARDWPQSAVKSERSAAALRGLAAYLDSLPADDPLLDQIAGLYGGDFPALMSDLRQHAGLRSATGKYGSWRPTPPGGDAHRQMLAGLVRELSG